jgi:ArsR family transcriptional regulator
LTAHSSDNPDERMNAIATELGLLADTTRTRLLAVLDGVELTVAELCDTLALPQSTVSRHLKPLADAGWVRARRDGTSRFYGLTVDELGEASRRLWALVHDEHAGDHDLHRRAAVLERRHAATNLFFEQSAADWDALRSDLYGPTSDLRVLPALLDPSAVVGDLGCGSGRVTAMVAPFVARVIAVDPSPAMLDVARARLVGERNVTLAGGTLEDLPIDDATLDVALVLHVLHHVGDPVRALAEAARTLVPGGRLVVADMLPHANEEYRGTMGHVWLGFERASLEAAVAAAGLTLERWHEPPIEAGAHGPALFIATARRPHTGGD